MPRAITFEARHNIYRLVTRWYAKSQSAWKGVIVLASILYLLMEVIFNARLVDIAGDISIDYARFESIEVFGRALSAFGISLLIISLLTFRAGLEIAVPRALLILAIVWPVAYWGQKYAIDYYIINPSTSEQRQEAYGARLARLALSQEALEIEGVTYGAGHPESAKGKTFYTLFGAFVFIDKELLGAIRAREDDLAREYLKHVAYRDFEKHYGVYSDARDQVRESFVHYQAAQEVYRDKQKAIAIQVDREVRSLNARIEAYWDRYYAGVEEHDQRMHDKARIIAPKIYRYFKSITSKGCSDSCQNRLNVQYREEIQKLGYGYIPPKQWLIKSEETAGAKASQVASSIAMGVLTGGLSLVLQGVDAVLSGGNDGYRYSFTDDVNHYHKILLDLPAVQQSFQVKSKGIPYGIENAYRFMQSPEVAAAIRRDLQGKGIRVPGDWVPEQKNVFGRALGRKLEADLEKAWQAEHKIPVGLSWHQFQRSAAVQNQFAAALGKWYRKPMLADWNDAEFRQFVLEPAISRSGQEFLAEMKASTVAFADGQRYEDQGKEALRAIVVPPIAMGISLLLSIITAARLGLMLLFRCVKLTFPARLLIRCLAIPVVLIIPLGIGMIAQSANDEGVGYFVDTMREEAHPITGSALIWVLTLQPIVHPIGNIVASGLPIFEIFHDNVGSLPSGFSG